MTSGWVPAQRLPDGAWLITTAAWPASREADVPWTPRGGVWAQWAPDAPADRWGWVPPVVGGGFRTNFY